MKERRGVGDSCEKVTSERLEASVDTIIRILRSRPNTGG